MPDKCNAFSELKSLFENPPDPLPFAPDDLAVFQNLGVRFLHPPEGGVVVAFLGADKLLVDQPGVQPAVQDVSGSC